MVQCQNCINIFLQHLIKESQQLIAGQIPNILICKINPQGNILWEMYFLCIIPKLGHLYDGQKLISRQFIYGTHTSDTTK